MRAAVIGFVGTDLAHLPGGRGASVSGSWGGFWVSSLESAGTGLEGTGTKEEAVQIHSKTLDLVSRAFHQEHPGGMDWESQPLDHQ